MSGLVWVDGIDVFVLKWIKKIQMDRVTDIAYVNPLQNKKKTNSGVKNIQIVEFKIVLLNIV